MAQTRIFTDEGISKLQTLKATLSQPMDFESQSQTFTATSTASLDTSSSSSAKSIEKTYLSSDYSQNMLTEVINIIDTLLEHNNINHFKQEKNRDALYEHIQFLDGERGTYVPEIFNAQSYALALQLKTFLASINLQEDITPQAKTILSPLINLDSILGIMKNNLHFACQLYDRFMQIPEHYKTYKEFSTEIKTQYEQWFDITKSLTSDAFILFQSDYEKKCADFLEKIKSLPYVRIANDESLVDKEVPYSFCSGDLVISGMRGGLIDIMIKSEKVLNQELQKNSSCSIITTIYDVLSKKCQGPSVAHLKIQFDQLMDKIIQHAESYKTGGHLSVKSIGVSGLFKSVNPDKVKIFNACAAELMALKTTATSKKINLSTGERIFSAIGILLDALQENTELATLKKISVGELSKIFNAYTMTLMSMRFDGLNESNDDLLFKTLQFYKEDLKLEEKISSTSKNTRS